MNRQETVQSGNNNTLRKKIIWTLWLLYGALVLGIVILFVLISGGRMGYMPSFEELENPQSSLASEVYSYDDVLLGKFFIENRTDATYNEISPYVINALIATEDIRFMKHSGIDFRALVRAVVGVLTGSSKGGGSTITQQLAKLLFHENPGSALKRVRQKLNEWVIAVKLEQRYSKEEILTLYLNKFDFVNNAVGIKSAARIYFNTSPDSLSLEQSALLVGMAKNPAFFNPVRRPDTSRYRRNIVLGQMMKYGFIDRQTFDSVKTLPVDMSRFKRQNHITGPATYFREYLRSELREWCASHLKPDGTPYNIYRDGLRIYTTIDSKMQQYAEEAVTEHLGHELQPAFFRHWSGYPNAPFSFERNAKSEIDNIMNQAMVRSERYRRMKAAGITADSIRQVFHTPAEMRVFSWAGERDTLMTPMDSIRYYKFFLQAGLMSVEPGTGFVKAYVGGVDYKHFMYDHATLAKRQVGSTFKPFLYTLAMENGMSPCDMIPNIQPVIYLETGKTWEPRNTNTKDIGTEITLKYALATSNNWISGHLVKRFPPQSVVHMARKMGVTSFLDPVPAIVLGSSDMSLYELIGAMNTYNNKGIYQKPVFITRIEDKQGNVIESFVPEQQEAMSEETAYLMLELMKGVVEYGTGVRLRFKYGFNHPVAGKTGTTNNHSDGWFIGLVPELSTGVWVGCEDRSAHFRTLTLGQGANMALPVWALFMQKIYDDPTLLFARGDFTKPSRPLSVEIDCENQESVGNPDNGWFDEDF